MSERPFTIITAFHQEMAHWEFTPAEKALLTAFVFCLKLRMDGSDFDQQFGTPAALTEPTSP